ncbi:amidohydrolase family protein [Rhizobium sp. BK251]|uniref:amidohydrolase family protein n=1 Tax=Rhizobium sp. BK251 TaxID=2512125 RepID=UPI0010444807|nr:amidohydrolase family protein [Rhizobium sp. BK251]TCL63644.1 cytosine/adenosine deaminase-related metal-dependent hydrolase [Rhizobium sp. BK251]
MMTRSGAARGHDILIRGGSVIIGDGRSFLERASVRIRGGEVVSVESDGGMPGDDVVVIEAQGCTTLPGIINAHAHGCAGGPSMPSGSKPFAPTEIEYFRNRHLLAGTTTLLNVCGLSLADEINAGVAASHPLDIHVATAHTLSSLAAAMAIDGKGLKARHRRATIDSQVAAGAKALGEAGGGQTLGGGAQDYRFIPAAIEAMTGIRIHPRAARSLKEAVLGRYLDGSDGTDDDRLQALIAESGLPAGFGAGAMRRLIESTVLPPVALARQGFREIAEHSARLGLPALFHSATPTAATLISLAEAFPKARIVAGHSNHPMFTPEESVRFAHKLKQRGATIEVSTLDCIETRFRNGPDNLDALVGEGLVDTLATDFAGGDWDPILSAIHRIIRKGQLSSAAAVALATGNVAKAFPQLAGDRGMIARGKRADIVVCDEHNLSRVRHVIIKGRIVVFNGAILPPTDQAFPGHFPLQAPVDRSSRPEG